MSNNRNDANEATPPRVTQNAEPPNRRISGALFLAFGRLWKETEAALEPLGIRNAHFWLLFALREHGPMSQVSLMKHISVDRTTMVHLVDDLERLGLVERAKDPKDRRANAVRLKSKGETVLSQGERRITEAEAEFMAVLSPEEREQLCRLLNRVSGPE